MGNRTCWVRARWGARRASSKSERGGFARRAAHWCARPFDRTLPIERSQHARGSTRCRSPVAIAPWPMFQQLPQAPRRTANARAKERAGGRVCARLGTRIASISDGPSRGQCALSPRERTVWLARCSIISNERARDVGSRSLHASLLASTPAKALAMETNTRLRRAREGRAPAREGARRVVARRARMILSRRPSLKA